MAWQHDCQLLSVRAVHADRQQTAPDGFFRYEKKRNKNLFSVCMSLEITFLEKLKCLLVLTSNLLLGMCVSGVDRYCFWPFTVRVCLYANFVSWENRSNSCLSKSPPKKFRFKLCLRFLNVCVCVQYVCVGGCLENWWMALLGLQLSQHASSYHLLTLSQFSFSLPLQDGCFRFGLFVCLSAGSQKKISLSFE